MLTSCVHFLCVAPGMVGDCTKLSYKLKFNHVDPDARFFGLKMLQLHAASSDVSKMRERLSYGLFREMGVPAPRYRTDGKTLSHRSFSPF